MLLEILMTPFTIERIKDMKPQDDIRLKSSKSQSLMYRKVGLKFEALPNSFTFHFRLFWHEYHRHFRFGISFDNIMGY